MLDVTVERFVLPKKRDKHYIGWWILLSVSFLLLSSLAIAPPDISLSIDGSSTATPFIEEAYTFETLISGVPIFSFQLDATIEYPNGSIENITSVDSFQGYKTAHLNFTQEGVHTITASVSLGGATQVEEFEVLVAHTQPQISLRVSSVDTSLMSGVISTDTLGNISLTTFFENQEQQLCIVECDSPSCLFSCEHSFSEFDVVDVVASLDESKSSYLVSILSFQEGKDLLDSITVSSFIEGQNNSIIINNSQDIILRALNTNNSQLYYSTKNGDEYTFSSLVKGDYVLEAYVLINDSYVVDTLSFVVESSPNVLSINPIQNSLVYSPQVDALYLRTSINIESADITKPVLIEDHGLFSSISLLRDGLAIPLTQSEGFFRIPSELLSSVIEIEIKLSGSPFNPTSLLPDSKPTIELRTSFDAREFFISTNATNALRYEIPLTSSFSYVWDMIDNKFIEDYFKTAENTLVVYSHSKNIILLESTLSPQTTNDIDQLFFNSKPLEYDAKSDITLPFDSSFIIKDVQAISRLGERQSVSFENNQLFTSTLDGFEYVLELTLNTSNESGIYTLPVNFIPNNTLSISQPKDLSAYAGEEVTYSYVITNRLEKTVLLDILVDTDLVSLSSQGYELLDNNKNGFLDTGILIPGAQMIISASVIVPENSSTGDVIPAPLKFFTSDDEWIRTVNIIVEKKAFEEGKRLNYFDIDLFDLSYENGELSISVRNNNLINELLVLDIQITTDENSFQKTIPLEIPADGIITEKIPVTGEQIFASAQVYFENGVVDTLPNNNKRQLLFNDAWLDGTRDYRLVIPISEKKGVDQDIFNLRSFISLDWGSQIDSLRAIVPTYNGGVFSYVDVPFELLLFDYDQKEGHIMFGVPNIKANEERFLYVYFDEEITQEESLPLKNTLSSWEYEEIIDNRNDLVSYVGSWFKSSSTQGYYGLDYTYDLNVGKGEKFVLINPRVPSSSYELYLYSPADSSFASNVPVYVEHVKGSDKIIINQKIQTTDWKYLGLYDLDGESQIAISNEGTDGFTVFDALKIVPVAQYIQDPIMQYYNDFIKGILSSSFVDEILPIIPPLEINETNTTVNESINITNQTSPLNISLNESINETNISFNTSINITTNITINATLNISLNESINETNISLNTSINNSQNLSIINIISPQEQATYNSSNISIVFSSQSNSSFENFSWRLLKDKKILFNSSILSSLVNETAILDDLTLNVSGKYSLQIVDNNQFIVSNTNFFVELPLPQNLSFEIVSFNGSSHNTSSPTVIVTQLGTHISLMRYSCDNTSWSQYYDWQAVLRNINLTHDGWGCSLDAGDKTLYAEFSNRQGSVVLSDSILLTTQPLISKNTTNETNTSLESMNYSLELATNNVQVIDFQSILTHDQFTFLSLDEVSNEANISYSVTASNLTLNTTNTTGNNSFELLFRINETDYIALNVFVEVIVYQEAFVEYVSPHSQPNQIRVGEDVIWQVASNTNEVLLPTDAFSITLENANGTNTNESNFTIEYEAQEITLGEYEEIKNIHTYEKELGEIVSKRRNANLFSKPALLFEESDLENKISALNDEKEELNLQKGKHILLKHENKNKKTITYSYKTPAPSQKETKLGLTKKIHIFSDVSMHYFNVATSTSIKETTSKPPLYHVIDGERRDISHDNSYQVQYLDTNNNGLYDTISWIVPHLSDQYFEVGVASINTDKSTYHPNDVAQITAVVLDTSGFLVENAYVEITITDPNNSTHKYTTDDSVSETSKGIYEVNFSSTSTQGTYLMNVQAIGAGVNNTLDSSFEVASYYAFDIIRTVPVTIDPWQIDLYSELTVDFYTADTTVTLIETIPSDLTIVDANGATVSTSGNSTTLTWFGVTDGDSKYYVAQIPKITPNLYELGTASINHVNGTYTEARPWFLAIDPLVYTRKDCTVVSSSGYGTNDNTGNCTQITTSDNSRPAGGDDALTGRESTGGVFTDAILTTTFDSDTPAGANITGAGLTVEWGVEDTTGSVCTLDVNNGTGWSTISTTCQGTAESTTNYDVSSYILDTDAANGFQFRMTYRADKTGGDRTDDLEVDYIYLEVNYTRAPGYNNWSINITDGANILRGENVLAYAHWNFSDGIVQSLLEHDGTGSDVNYTVPTPYTGDWTNYTINTSNTTEFNRVGVINLNTMYARDLELFNQTSPAFNFKLYDNSNISQYTLSQSTVNQSVSTDFACRVMDFQLNSPIEDYSVLFYRDGVYQSSIKTNATGWSTFSFSRSVPGTYALNCNISDSGYYYIQTGANNESTSVTVLDSSSPSITLANPANDSQDLDGNITFFFDVSDTYSGIENCSIYINGTVNTTNSTTISEVATNNISVQLINGTYNWSVGCYDNSINNNFAISSNRFITVAPDSTPPSVEHLSPPNAVTTSENVTIIFNVSDTLSAIDECTLILDGINNETNASGITNGDNVSFELYNLTFGLHTWKVNCTDIAGNKNITTLWTFTAGTDTTPPVVTITNPLNNSIDTDDYVPITFTVDDYLSGVDNCSVYINGTLNQTNISINESQIQLFQLNNTAEGSYYHQINCTDDSANNNSVLTDPYYFTVNYDYDLPVIKLISPANFYQDVDGDLDFYYNVTDESEITQCIFLINGTINQTDTTITKSTPQNFSLSATPNGDYNWAINCTDASDSANTSVSSVRTFSIGPDTIGPSITLFAPSNNSVDSDGVIAFTYSPDDITSGIDSCTLFIDGSDDQTDTGVSEGATEQFNKTLPDGSYQWYVNCTDDSPGTNWGVSETRDITVSISYESQYNFSLAYKDYSQGSNIDPNSLMLDEGGSPVVGATAYAFVVRNLGVDNQTTSWFNSSFARRVEIDITNDLPSSSQENIAINITLDTATLITDGYLNTDCSDLRFADQENNELNYYFYDADQGCNDASSKIILEIERIWKNRTHPISVYFNYSLATDNSSRSASAVVDNFDDQNTFDTNYWTTEFTNAADEWDDDNSLAYDGTNSSHSNINCNSQCATAGGRYSRFSKTISLTEEGTLYWNWRKSGASNLVFKLDGTQTDNQGNTNTWNQASEVIPAGTHTLVWEFENTANANRNAYVDQIYLIGNNWTLGSTSSQSTYVATLTPQTTDASGESSFPSWDSTGETLGNYSITGHAVKGSFWGDNGSISFRLVPDTQNPTYSSWALNVSDDAIVMRDEYVLAYSYWSDDVRLANASIEHDGTGSFVNYSIVPFGNVRDDWANYTLNMSNATEFSSLGLINTSTIYVNDTSDNKNQTSPSHHFYLYSRGEINDSSINTTAVDEGDSFTFNCQVRDEFNNAVISGYTVSFYFDGSLQGTDTTNATGWASYNVSTSVPGTNVNTYCSIGNETGIYYLQGAPNSSTHQINVTDVIAPQVGLYTLANDSVTTLPTHALSYLVNDTGVMDSCYLYGDWGSGWGVKKTDSSPDKGGFPFVNYFSSISFESGAYQWYVNCTDSAANWDVSPTWIFNVSLTKPNVDILDPLSSILYSPDEYNVTYRVQLPDPLIGIDNCSLFVDDTFNQSLAGPVTKVVNHTFAVSETFSYGRYKLNVSCAANNTLSGYDVQYLNILNLSLLNPANGTQVDRDEFTATSDTITFQAQETANTDNITLLFRANSTDPNDPSMKNVALGTAITNSTGTATLTLNPNSTLLAGTYEWWVSFNDWPNNLSDDRRTFENIGGSNVEFEHATLRPNSSYVYLNEVTASSILQSLGGENVTTLNDTYGATINATYYAPRTGALTHIEQLSFNGTSWVAQTNTTNLPNHGTWTINFSASTNTSSLIINSSELRTFFLNLSGYGIPAVNLNTPANDSTIFYDDLVANTSNITLNWTIIDSIESSVLCNLTINGAINQTNVTSLNNSPTLINLTFNQGGFYYWNVTCSDYANINSSETYEFKITPVDTSLEVFNYTVTGGNATLFERVNFTANYSNFYNESINASCVINFSDGLNDNMTYNVTSELHEYNRTATNGGWITWNVTCNNSYYANITSSNEQFYVERAKFNITTPINYTLDRDGTDAGDPDSVNIEGQLSAAVAGLTIDFYVSRLEPDAGEVYYLGSNTTNSSGHAVFAFNPNGTIKAGNYSIYGNGSVADTQLTQWTLIKGSLSIIMANASDHPASSYQRNETAYFRFNITSQGDENTTYLDDYHINTTSYVNITHSTTAENKSGTLTFLSGNIFNGSIFMNTSDSLELWNVSASSSGTYFYENISIESRQFNLTKINANLSIWDQYDSQGGYVPAYVGENVSFYANYTTESGTYISLQSCNFTYSDGDSDLATPNASQELHIVDDKLFFVPGYYTWTANCTNALYEEEILTDTIRIYPRTNTSVTKSIGSAAQDSMSVLLNLTNYAAYNYIIEAYDFIHYTEYANYNYSFGPNATNAINSGEYVGNATKFNITTNTGASSSITYNVNGTGDYNASDLYIVGV